MTRSDNEPCKDTYHAGGRIHTEACRAHHTHEYTRHTNSVVRPPSTRCEKIVENISRATKRGREPVLLTLLVPQSRFGDTPVKFQVVCPKLSPKQDCSPKRVKEQSRFRRERPRSERGGKARGARSCIRGTLSPSLSLSLSLSGRHRQKRKG